MSKREDQRIAALAKKNAAKVVVPKANGPRSMIPRSSNAPRKRTAKLAASSRK